MKTESIHLGDRTIGDGHAVFVVAEVGINHNGDLKLALELLKKAKEADADAVKLQTYVTEKRVPKDSPIFHLLKSCELSYQEQSAVFSMGRELGLYVFSTPFDDEAIDFLEQQNVPLLKVASFDIVNKSLLTKMAAIKTPVIISRGMATREELESALRIFDDQSLPSAILHCVSAYPVKSDSDLNLSTIPYLRKQYQRPIGYSDHTLGIDAPVWAVAAGAQIVEKHFTLSTNMKGPDHAISADPLTLKKMVSNIHRIECALGEPVTGPLEVEKDILQYRRPS